MEGALAVVFADINKSAAEEAAEEARARAKNLQFRATAIEVDVSNETSVDLMVRSVQREFGRIDYSVNSAGVSHKKSFLG